MTAVLVRRLGPPDVEAYRSIRLSALQTAPEAFSSVHGIEAAWPSARHAERLHSSLVFGAFDGGEIVGVIGFRRADGPRNAHKGFVWGFFVEPHYRQGGVGTALMSALMEAARAVVEQVLLSVIASNAGAVAFYERFGFARYGLEPRALKSAVGYADEVLMIVFLGEAVGPQT